MWRQELRNIVWPRNLPAVQFQLQELSSEQNRSFSMLADGYRKVCGCASSSFFMSVTAVATLISYFIGYRPININLRHVLTFVGITVLAALFGKLLGLIWARWRSLRLAAAVHHSISSAKPGTTTQPI
jgi:hypothetical protein